MAKFFPLTLVWLFLVAFAKADVSLEGLMRAYQERFQAAKNATKPWPNNLASEAAPSLPPDGFYARGVSGEPAADAAYLALRGQIIGNMFDREGLYDKTATAIRDIAGRHLFQDGNKRTAQAIAEQMMKANGGSATPTQIRSVIDQVGQGGLKSVEDISAALRGAN